MIGPIGGSKPMKGQQGRVPFVLSAKQGGKKKKKEEMGIKA